MSKRIITFIVAALALALAIGFYLRSRGDGPRYTGRPLSEWFQQYYRSGQFSSRSDETKQRQALKAIRAMDTNAVPWLAAQCFDIKPDPPLRAKVQPVLQNVFRFQPYVSPDEISWSACMAIREIRPPAEVLLPLVTNRLTDANPTNRYAAIALLGSVGAGAEQSLPWLTKALRSADVRENQMALQSLDWLGAAAEPVLPELIELLRTPKSPRAPPYGVGRVLGNLGPRAAAAVPLLRERLDTEANRPVRLVIATTLCQIDAGETNALQLLIEDLQTSTNSNRRSQAFWRFTQIGVNAKAAAPALLGFVDSKDQETWHAAANAVLAVGETNLLLPQLEAKLGSGDQNTRYNAMTLMLQLQPAHPVALTNLVEFLQSEGWCRMAIEEAAGLGAAAEPVLPALRELQNSRQRDVRNRAEAALKEIEQARAERAASQR